MPVLISAEAGKACPVFVSGIKYPSLSQAGGLSRFEGCGISYIALWKGLKKSGGEPVMVKKALVATGYWIDNRLEIIREKIPL